MYYQEKRRRRLVSWQTRNIAQFIAATMGAGEDQENPALTIASRLVIDEDELLELKVASQQAVSQAVSQPEGAENAPGSYEKLTRGFSSRR